LEEKIKENFSEEKKTTPPGTKNEIIEEICKKMMPNKSIEISESDIKALVILVMKKLEEGVYGI